MEKDQLLGTLDTVFESVHEKFDTDGLHQSRLEQFVASWKTTRMLVEHLFDEDVRHRDRPKAHLRAIGAYSPEAE
jgi:hypothetical protein